MKAYPYC